MKNTFHVLLLTLFVSYGTCQARVFYAAAFDSAGRDVPFLIDEIALRFVSRSDYAVSKGFSSVIEFNEGMRFAALARLMSDHGIRKERTKDNFVLFCPAGGAGQVPLAWHGGMYTLLGLAAKQKDKRFRDFFAGRALVVAQQLGDLYGIYKAKAYSQAKPVRLNMEITVSEKLVWLFGPNTSVVVVSSRDRAGQVQFLFVSAELLAAMWYPVPYHVAMCAGGAVAVYHHVGGFEDLLTRLQRVDGCICARAGDSGSVMDCFYIANVDTDMEATRKQLWGNVLLACRFLSGVAVSVGMKGSPWEEWAGQARLVAEGRAPTRNFERDAFVPAASKSKAPIRQRKDSDGGSDTSSSLSESLLPSGETSDSDDQEPRDKLVKKGVPLSGEEELVVDVDLDNVDDTSDSLSAL